MNVSAKNILLLEDDSRLLNSLAVEFNDRGYHSIRAQSLNDVLRSLDKQAPDFAVVDLRLRGEDGLSAIGAIRAKNRACRIVVLTGYGSIATAVEAIKAGCVDYLVKPVDVSEIEAALLEKRQASRFVWDEQPSLAKREREYIEYVLQECRGNISLAARKLGLHRQSLQRKLKKYPPRR